MNKSIGANVLLGALSQGRVLATRQPRAVDMSFVRSSHSIPCTTPGSWAEYTTIGIDPKGKPDGRLGHLGLQQDEDGISIIPTSARRVAFLTFSLVQI
jgi:hypothetical protein